MLRLNASFVVKFLTGYMVDALAAVDADVAFDDAIG
jgi:hypothetical protein